MFTVIVSCNSLKNRLLYGCVKVLRPTNCLSHLETGPTRFKVSSERLEKPGIDDPYLDRIKLQGEQLYVIFTYVLLLSLQHRGFLLYPRHTKYIGGI